MRFCEEAARPAAETGPVDSCALAWLAARRASEMGCLGVIEESDGNGIPGSGMPATGMVVGWRLGWETGFAGEFQFFVRGGTAFFAVHID